MNRVRPRPGDTSGFALKFYTEQGNHDMVRNNTPVFFVRNPMRFQDFIRPQKRHPDSAVRDHNMQWGFWTLSPESAHTQRRTPIRTDRRAPTCPQPCL